MLSLDIVGMVDVSSVLSQGAVNDEVKTAHSCSRRYPSGSLPALDNVLKCDQVLLTHHRPPHQQPA
jgi:hypothetical protein